MCSLCHSKGIDVGFILINKEIKGKNETHWAVFYPQRVLKVKTNNLAD